MILESSETSTNFKPRSLHGEVRYIFYTLLTNAADHDVLPEIDLGNLVHELDSTASDIVANQRDSLVQRKELAQKTKDFRKLDDEAKLQDYKGLLKGT